MELTTLGITQVAAITVICMLAGQAAKLTALENRWIPVLCGICGGALGVLGMRIMPDFPADDVLTAAAVGIVSGFAATGIHQAAKGLGGAV